MGEDGSRLITVKCLSTASYDAVLLVLFNAKTCYNYNKNRFAVLNAEVVIRISGR